MSGTPKITIAALEKQVMEKEGIRIVARAPKDMEVDPYPFQRRATGNTSIAALKRNRLDKALNNIPYEIVGGNGVNPHGKTSLDSMRESYS